MKGLSAIRALMLGSAIGLGQALAPSKLVLPPVVASTRPRGKGKNATAPVGAMRRAVRLGQQLLDSGFWGRANTISSRRPSPASPEGMRRIEAARLKRATRALKADRDVYRSWCGNPCQDCSDRKNPTYVNRPE